LCLNVVSLYAVVLFICYVYLYIVINYMSTYASYCLSLC